MKLTYKPGGMPPGGYPYTDPRSGKTFDGFDAGGAGDQALRIAKYRRANPHIFPEPDWIDPGFIAHQILDFQVLRLPRRFFIEVNHVPRLPPAGSRKANPVIPETGGKCGCGGDLMPIHCATCKGKRVVGWTCGKCGKKIGR